MPKKILPGVFHFSSPGGSQSRFGWSAQWGGFKWEVSTLCSYLSLCILYFHLFHLLFRYLLQPGRPNGMKLNFAFFGALRACFAIVSAFCWSFF